MFEGVGGSLLVFQCVAPDITFPAGILLPGTAASIGFCALQSSEAFIAQMKKAQAEYKEKTGQTVGVKSAKVVEHPATHAFQQNAIPATTDTHGVVIEKNKKVMKK